jgi:hypothetical protein
MRRIAVKARRVTPIAFRMKASSVLTWITLEHAVRRREGSRMNEYKITGAEIVRWLKQDDAQPDLLVGSLFDDDHSETAWLITAATADGLTLLDPESGLRQSLVLRRLAAGTVIATGPASPLAIALQRLQTPLEALTAQLRPYLRGDLSRPLDAPLLFAAIQDWEAGRLPEREDRARQAETLKANRQWRLGARIAGDWWKAVENLPTPPADVVLHLGRFLREAHERRAALGLVEGFMARRPTLTLTERVFLETHLAALYADMFEHHSKRDGRYLDKADNMARHAYGLSKNAEVQRDASQEIGPLLNRIDGLAGRPSNAS